MTNTVLPVNGYMDTANIQAPHAGQLTSGGGPNVDKAKEWQMELLMEKLRSKASSFKSLVETAKHMRMAMLDKRFALDSVEKNQLQKCLDTLQHSIKVISLQSMMERLESLTRQLGLKFTPSHHGTEVFISSDMFFLEVLLESTGAVKDVKIHHEGKNEPQSCEELAACLSRGDFVDFTAQLEGLMSIYQLNADKKVKCRAFSALQSLETDLGVLAQLQTFIKEPFNLVHKSPVGILERRKGGHPMKLTYFVSPYDLIDCESKSCDTLSLEAVVSRKIGHSVTVCMEGSTAHKLPTCNIIAVNRSPTGKSTPSYAPLTSVNSSMLPACFVLKLAKKMPMCLELIRRIQKVTELECVDVSAPHPLLSMIVQYASNGQLDCRNNRGLYVTLPDQQHCYCMTENKNMEGIIIGSIPFTHPAHVPQILVYLRQQALFNTLISSCVRPMARQDIEASTMFEVSALSWQCISVSLEHPFEETMATVELDLMDTSALKCRLYGLGTNNNDQISELAGKALQRCLSIPLTMRTLIRAWESRTSIGVNCIGGGNGNYNVNLGNGRDESSHNGSGLPDFGNGDVKIKQEPGTMNGTGALTGRQQSSQQPLQQQQQQQQQQSFLDAGTESSIGFPSYPGQSSDTSAAMLNPLQLGALLGQAKISSTATLPTPPGERSKKARKRKAADGSWRSPKRKTDQETNEILLESSSSDSTPLGTPTSSRDNQNETRTPTPTSAASMASGLDLSNLDTSDIIGTDKSSDYDIENENEIMEVHDVQNISEDLKRERKSKKREEKKSPTTIFEESKSLVPPSVSITPISSSGIGQSSNYTSVLTGMGLERRPGIEIIPITSSQQATLPSSITITPITGPNTKDTEERKERKSSKNRSSSDDSKNKLEKKRKRKREESPMGPPEKLPPKQDPLSKPVSVSIKPTESPPSSLNSSRPTSPATTLRKFSPSPTRTSPLALVGKSSPTLKQNTNKPIQSPKHSPVYSSPKHIPMIPANVSPKHGISSPKHGNSGSAGKPSMSALKSAANSPSNKCDGNTPSKCKSSSSSSSSSVYSSSVSVTTASSSSSSSNKDSIRDKDKKTSLTFGSSSGRQSPKSKSSCGKPKQLDCISIGSEPTTQQSSATGSAGVNVAGSTTPPSELCKSGTAQQQARNRKGSLSAVIDKLKNAQNCTDDGANGSSKLSSVSASMATTTITTSSGSGGSGQKERNITPSNKLNVEGKSIVKNPSLDTKNPAEYMVKHSSDGMKITINKTRTKDAKSSSNLKMSSSGISTTSSVISCAAGNGSPKTHTGLKPGVNSGPASKKPQTQAAPKLHSISPITSGSGTGGSGSNKTAVFGNQKIAGGSKSSSSSSLVSSGGSLTKSSSTKSSASSSVASSSSNSGSPKTTSSGATDLSRVRDKSRFSKSGDKNLFASSKGGDIRKSSPSSLREESDSERAFKLLAHASMSSIQSLPGLPPQLVVEGLMKQLDTKFQIPKLSARANADSVDKRSSSSTDKLPESVGKVGIDNLSVKQSDQISRSSPMHSNQVSTVSSKSLDDHQSSGSSGTNVNFSTGASPGGLMLPPSQSSLDSDVPTNLSMQPDDTQSREACKFLGSSSNDDSCKDNSDVLVVMMPKLSDSHSTSTKQYSPNDSVISGGNLKTLNLSTKPSERDQQIFQTPSLDGGIVPSTSSSSTATSVTSTSPQEAAEMLLDFSTPKEAIKGSLSHISDRDMNQVVPLRRNTPPPPPPPPPPPTPPSSSHSLLPTQTSSTGSALASVSTSTPISMPVAPSFPPSPSVSVHIVKSPAPSPRVIPPSPHSASPCITDDELMDEALVGIRTGTFC